MQGTDPPCLLVHSFWSSAVPTGDSCVGPSLLDVNECITGSHSCRLGETCINTVGSFRCQRDSSCGTGYELTEHNDCKGTARSGPTILFLVDRCDGKGGLGSRGLCPLVAAWGTGQCCGYRFTSFTSGLSSWGFLKRLRYPHVLVRKKKIIFCTIAASHLTTSRLEVQSTLPLHENMKISGCWPCPAKPRAVNVMWQIRL